MSDVKTPSNYLPLKLPKKDFLQFKQELEKFLSTRKEEYKNLFESFDILKQKKLHLPFLLFSYYNSWIFPYISYNKITRGNIFSSTFEISFIFKKLSKNMNCPFDEKLFILWYFYIYYNFFIKEKKLNPNVLVNQLRYILYETGKIVINLFEQKYLSLNSVINILDMNLLCFEYFFINSEFQQFTMKVQKLRRLIFFFNYFHLLKKISVITLKQKSGFDTILTYLDKVKHNSEINNEININMLLNNNILQDFLQEILNNIDIVELKKAIPNFDEQLINFYTHFVKHKYIISKSFNSFVDTLKHSFEHLYNFKNNKNLIISDIFKNNLNSILLNKLYKSESKNVLNLEELNQLNSSFFFDTKKSNIAFENTKKMTLDQVILFFSFRIGNNNSTSNQELPLLLITRKNKKKEKRIALQIFLKQAEKDKYKLYISQHKDDTVKILNEDSDIMAYQNQNHFCAVYLNGKKIKIYLLSELIKKGFETTKKEIICNQIPKDEIFYFNLGKDDSDNNFYNGNIGPFIIVKAPKVENLVNKDIDKLILDILSLYENYKDFIIKKSELSKNYSLRLKDYSSQKFFDETNNEKIEKIKGSFECLLYLNPEILKFFKNRMFNEENSSTENKKIPMVYEKGNQNYEFIITNLNVTVFNDENIAKLFIADNGINYISLLFEYYDQFLRYYLLKKDKEKIFDENEFNIVLKEIIQSIKNILLMLGNHNYSKYTYNSSKKILNNLYKCILNLNKIKPVFAEFFDDIVTLKGINKGVLLTYKNGNGSDKYKNENNNNKLDLKNKKDYEIINNNNFVDFNISYFMGIVEILTTPEFYNNTNNKDNIFLIEKLLNLLFKAIKDLIEMIDLSFIQNFFYKLLSFFPILKNSLEQNEEKEKNEIKLNEDKNQVNIGNINNEKYQLLIKSIFGIIIDLLNSKIDKDIKLAKDYFHKLFLFVFGCNRNDYDVILAYLNVIDESSQIKKSLQFDENQILELKNFLFISDKKKDNKESQNDENINNINIYDEKKKKIQNLIINKIYEFKFTKGIFCEVQQIKMNFLEDFLQRNKMTKDLFIQIQNLFKKYFVDIFKNINDVNNPILDLNLEKLNKYFQTIFDFLKFILNFLKKNILKNEDTVQYVQYLKNIYEIMLEALQYIKFQNTNFDKCIIFIVNYLEFIYLYLNNDKLYFLTYHEEKILKIIDELFDKCIESTLINCNFYLILKDENNLISSTQEKKLIFDVFFDIYNIFLEKIYNEYRAPDKNKNEVDKNDLALITNFNSVLGKKIISPFSFENYDVKKLSYVENSKSIFFASDFLRLTLEKKYYKKYMKVKEISQQIEYYQKMISILINLKADFIELNNKFDYFHTTYFFYELYDLYNNRFLSYINDEEIQKNENLKQSLEETKTILLKLKKIILNDHFKLNLICKDIYYRKLQTTDSNLKNMLRSIQVIIFNKKLKNIEKIDLVNAIETEFSTNEIKLMKENSINSRGSSNSGGSNPQKRHSNSTGSKDSSDGTPNKNNEIILSSEIYKEPGGDFIFVNEKNIKNNEILDYKYEINEQINESFNEQIEILKNLINKSHFKNNLDKLDKFSSINPKKEFMKTIFAPFFSDSFFENETFKKMKMLYLNTIDQSNPDTKLFNYPSKLKNFVNGLESSYFLKDNNKFFISKIFPITHRYFYDYMLKHHIYDESIILLKPNLSFEEKEGNDKSNTFDCELVKTDKTYYGQIINSEKERLLFFTSKKYELIDSKKDPNEIVSDIKKRGFSLSSLKMLTTDNFIKAKEKATNDLLDTDIFIEEEFNYNKNIIIFYDDIEEIVEKRFLYIWQAIEIFLKNGKSYMINMLNKENYEGLTKSLKNIPNVLFREKDFFQKTHELTNFWREKKMDTYEYLLYINKFGSRSFNDISQYYIFPWILLDFSNIRKIDKKEKEIFEFKKKFEKDKNEEKNENKEGKEHAEKGKEKFDKDILELCQNFRNFKYPVSAQEAHHRNIKKDKYNDEDECYKCHHGTHYSTSSYVDYFLMRNEPFTTLLVELQNYSQEDPNRLLLRLRDTISIISTGYDNRELIPELYSKFDFCININCAFYGKKKNKELVDDIDLTFEKKNNKIFKFKTFHKITVYPEFIILHKKLLNSDIIASNISKWIDNVFGYMQIPPEKKIENSINIFPKPTYEQLNNLFVKLDKLCTKYSGDYEKVIKKFVNRINVITSFGQCPYKLFSEGHKNREKMKQSDVNSDENSDNYGLQDDYLGCDFIDTYIKEEIKNDNNKLFVKSPGFYFEVNPYIEKVFILSETNDITIIDTNFYSFSNPRKYDWTIITDIKLPSICLFNKIKLPNNNNYYIYNIKYAFSSFPNKVNTLNLYANEYIDRMQNHFETKAENFKIITCRHIDNSFKLHFVTLNIKKKKLKENITCSHICEDFVMCCKAIDYNSFIIGLRNGKLIKALIHEFNYDNDKNKKKLISTYDIIFEKYVTGHSGSINLIEIDKKLNIVITAGDDNKLFIRKLYDFEILTCIKVKSKYIITMAKVSPVNLLYLICFNRVVGQTVIFGYSLSGIKFAKSAYSFYSNLEFTQSGNIITLINKSEIKLLYGHDLNEMIMNEEDKDYKKYINVKNSINSDSSTIGWIHFADFKKYYGIERNVISYTPREPLKKEFNLETLKVTNISYFE